MSVSSLEYLLCLLLACVIFPLLPGSRSRQLAFAACSAAFLFSYMRDWQSWAVLLGFLLSGYGCAALLRTRPSRGVFTTYLVLLVVIFAFLKKYVFLHVVLPERVLDIGIEIVGLSYILFRQIHFIVDSMQGQIETPSLWSYLNYQVNSFTLLAGPIQRYQDFQEYWEKSVSLDLDRHEILKLYLRLFVGVIKIVLVSRMFQSGYDYFLDQLEQSGGSTPAGWKLLVQLILMLYCFLLYLYMNFSGYCDVVIAGASLVGLKLPENFHAPFLARNILDYWSRWHITLGLWIRDYLFTPFYTSGAERFPRHSTVVAVVAYLVAFTLAGIWHGSTWNFFVYGALHGAAASAAKLWENAIVKRGGRALLKRYLQSAAIRRVAIVGTFHYACFTLFFFALALDRGQRILETVIRSLSGGY
jgi:D-alanyl-lipoteichoic acid acyltransferase DltB (MBOAT superfamily)